MFSIKLINLNFSVILAIILLMNIIGTILELFLEDSNLYIVKMFQCFSMHSNTRSLFTVQHRPKYPWIEGLRVLLTFLIILAHTSVAQGLRQLIPLSPFNHYPDDLIRLSMKPLIPNGYIVASARNVIKSYIFIG